MFNLTLDTKIPTVRETVDVLQRHVNDFGVPLDFDRMQEYIAYFTLKRNVLLRRIISYTGSNKTVSNYKDSDFLDFLVKADAARYLKKTGKDNYSLNDESIKLAIASGCLTEEIQKLMEMYNKAKSYGTIISPFTKIIENNPIVNLETFDNHRMLLVQPIAVDQNTGRIGYQNPAITNFSRVVQDILTVPKGWVLCQADSGQIDPRISQSFYIKDKQLIKCTMMYNDAYYGYLHYCTYLTDEQRRSGTLDLQPIEITDEMKDKRQKYKTFGNAVMYGSTDNKEGDIDKANFIKYIGNHPARLKKQHEVEKAVLNGQTVFYTAFGNPIDIMAGPSAKEDLQYGEDERFKRRVNRAINSPIQGTAADLFRYSVYKADKLLMRKAPNSRILAYVHDSGKFMIHEDEYDTVINDIKEMVSYQVEDWIPIYGDYEEGTHHSDIKRFIM